VATEFINNLTGENHAATIAKLFRQADRVTIVSPFLMPDFNKYLDSVRPKTLLEIHLVTTLVPRSPDQIKKVRSMTSLLDWCNKNEVSTVISVNNKLHGKIYIFQHRGIFQAAIVSSANFTNSGLNDQHEWGVLIRDAVSVSALYEQVTGCIEFPGIRHDDISRMAAEIEDYLKKQGRPPRPKIPVSLLKNITGLPALRISSETNFWLKPIGHAHGHVSPDRKFDQERDRLHFAKRRPKNISVGDILIAFAVGSGKIISVYKMMTPPHYAPDEERWPWYVTGKNMTKDYGRDWWANDLDIYRLLYAFDKNHPNTDIKPRGVQSFEGFKWGLDRMQITPAFGNFILEKVGQKTEQ
jgi:hypothetical protein